MAMKKQCIPLLLLVSFLVNHGAGAQACLWYNKPATDWQKEALPIGSGSLSAMILGDASKWIALHYS